ncbi:auxin-responsive protein IAA13-like isoform X2 [Silene latifolia]|uniref:auxin-responsive protein IAA13-like isoform X2 n=1 Tax=Silene latifolia TaxID=37657 RepID=UPI003D779FBF
MEVESGSSVSSTVEQHTRHFDQTDQMAVIQYGYEGSDDSSHLELGLGLTLSLVSPPSASFSSSSSSSKTCTVNSALTNVNNNVSAATKRPTAPTALSQVVGWPPIRSYRMTTMANQPRSVDENKGKDGGYGTQDKGNPISKERVPHKSSLFVKVNMDGVAIGRKVDLNAHSDYESLARALEDMFTNTAEEELVLMPKVTRPSKLLDGTSDFVITYEDKDGDWMLVGDVPWGLFVTSVKRLKIMRTSEANGLPPRSEVRSSNLKSRPI